MSSRRLLTAVEQRLAEEPDHVLPTLQLIADPDAVLDGSDEHTSELARTLNVHREVALLRELRTRSYSTAQVAELLGGVTRQAVSLRVRNRRLLAIEISGRSWFPSWQFAGGRPVDGLQQVIDALGEYGDDVLVLDAIVRRANPEERGRSAADLLAAGELDRALHYIRVSGF